MKGEKKWLVFCFALFLASFLGNAATAAEEINAKGGVKGKKLELLFEDDTGKPDVGRSATEKLISQEKVPVITGGYSSSVTAAATAVAQQFKVPFLVTTGSAD